MRAATLEKAVLHNEAGEFAGICLGFDFCSEHEWGIAELKRAFGIPDRSTRQLLGADARTVRKVPAGFLRLYRNKANIYLMYSPSLAHYSESKLTAPLFDDIMESKYSDADLCTAWSERDFGIRLKNGVTNLFSLEKLFQALNEHDAMFFLGAPKPFGGRGLVICIRSALDAEFLQQMSVADTDWLDLQDAVAATGIVERLKAARRSYFALSPRWKDDQKTQVIFWLNPMEQHLYNAGWFTVQDLDDWIHGRGPIPMAGSTG